MILMKSLAEWSLKVKWKNFKKMVILNIKTKMPLLIIEQQWFMDKHLDFFLMTHFNPSCASCELRQHHLSKSRISASLYVHEWMSLKMC